MTIVVIKSNLKKKNVKDGRNITFHLDFFFLKKIETFILTKLKTLLKNGRFFFFLYRTSIHI